MKFLKRLPIVTIIVAALGAIFFKDELTGLVSKVSPTLGDKLSNGYQKTEK